MDFSTTNISDVIKADVLHDKINLEIIVLRNNRLTRSNEIYIVIVQRSSNTFCFAVGTYNIRLLNQLKR